MRCCDCEKTIETMRGVAYQVLGFEQQRKAGGTNQVLFGERTGRVLCADCVLDRKHGVFRHEGQLRLG